ncbi:Protein fam72a [Rhizophlyctis rosea]|nr:Protein fam72a [Rhizophlyctis rosea]
MKAILLGNTKVELYSTDTPPVGVQLVWQDYVTQNCLCRIRDAACLGCGNVVGYHVTQPCEKCLDACNNGHFWMFLSDGVQPIERLDHSSGGKPLRWAALPCAEQDHDEVPLSVKYEMMCR